MEMLQSAIKIKSSVYSYLCVGAYVCMCPCMCGGGYVCLEVNVHVGMDVCPCLSVKRLVRKMNVKDGRNFFLFSVVFSLFKKLNVTIISIFICHYYCYPDLCQLLRPVDSESHKASD